MFPSICIFRIVNPFSLNIQTNFVKGCFSDQVQILHINRTRKLTNDRESRLPTFQQLLFMIPDMNDIVGRLCNDQLIGNFNVCDWALVSDLRFIFDYLKLIIFV